MQMLIKILFGGTITVALTIVCWLIWDMLPGYLRGTVLWDYRTLTRVLSIFLLLSLAEILVVNVWSKLFHEKD